MGEREPRGARVAPREIELTTCRAIARARLIERRREERRLEPRRTRKFIAPGEAHTFYVVCSTRVRATRHLLDAAGGAPFNISLRGLSSAYFFLEIFPAPSFSTRRENIFFVSPKV